MIKTIFAPLGGGQSDEPVLDTALTLARRFEAHIAALHCNVDPADAAAASPPVSFLVGPALGTAMDHLSEREQRRSSNALHTFNAFCEYERLPIQAQPGPGLSAHLELVDGAPWDVLPAQARQHDLVVMGRKHFGDDAPESMVSDVLVKSGQPLLLVPEYSYSGLLDCVMLCWKDTAGSARALRAALPLLCKARRVVVATVTDDAPVPTAGVLRHLAWHQVQATSLEAQQRQNTMDTLWSCARDSHATLVVMGGYSRSPLRELAFGGCTYSALSRGELPILIVP